MGFFKRILSLGSKKSKQRKPAAVIPEQPVHTEFGIRSTVEEDSEAVANQLLRSSSARYAVVAEVNYTDLPPLPHPINQVINPPSASTSSLVSSTISQRGTYTVKVHARQRHSSTEFPNAYPEISGDFETPRPRKSSDVPMKDNSQLLRLRSDPSVASLLDLYDEHGRISQQVFSNSPPKVGRQQTRRSGSTLRELLGDPAADNSNEGAISWAERYLDEINDSASPTSSLIQTPIEPDSHLCHDPSIMNDTTISHLSESFNNSAISSLDVEISTTSGAASISQESIYNPLDMKTPRRASQVFGFLVTKRRSTMVDAERPLPDPPCATPSISRRSSRSSILSHHSQTSSAIPSSKFNNTHRDSLFDFKPPGEPFKLDNSRKSTAEHGLVLQCDSSDVEPTREVKIILTNPTTVIVTAPTPSNNPLHNMPPSRIPRGPRQRGGSTNAVRDQHRRQRRPTTYQGDQRRPMLTDRSNSLTDTSSNTGDAFTPAPRKHKAYKTSASSTSTSLAEKRPSISMPMKQSRTTKENVTALQATAELPYTPIRSSSRSSLFRSAVSPAFFRQPVDIVPSPASSSDLSPVGRQVMKDVRARHRTGLGEVYRSQSSYR